MDALLALLLAAGPCHGGTPLALSTAPVKAGSPSGPSPAEAEPLFAGRGDPEKLARAMAIWEAALAADPQAYEPAWRLAHAWYFKGSHEEKRKPRMEAYLKGIENAEKAVSLGPDRAEGHFWLGVLIGSYAREKGIFKSLQMIRPIRLSFERAMKADPGYERGGPDRALGRYYHELPGWLGGSEEKSLEHLERSMALSPTNTLTLLYLGDTLAALGRKDEARTAFQEVLDAPVDPAWETEDQDNKALAERALKKLGK